VHRAAENGADTDMKARVQAKQGQLDPPTAQEVRLPSASACCFMFAVVQ